MFFFAVEAIFTEVFTTNGGEIEMIRISGRKFCHIRFKKEESVDKAMSLSGMQERSLQNHYWVTKS